jgi:hypothetical protein
MIKCKATAECIIRELRLESLGVKKPPKKHWKHGQCSQYRPKILSEKLKRDTKRESTDLKTTEIALDRFYGDGTAYFVDRSWVN